MMRIPSRLLPLAIAVVGSGAVALVAACSGSTGPSANELAACGAGTLLSVSPVASSDIRELAPLGNLNPPGHTFPTDHMYFYGTFPQSFPVVAPGAIRVIRVTLQKRTGGGVAEFDDYGVDFSSCRTQHFWFGHLASLSPGFSASVGAIGSSCNAPYQTGGYTFQQCIKAVSIDLAAGAAIGTGGGPLEGALDLGGIDDETPALAYVNPSRAGTQSGLHTVCPVDYFVAGVREALRLKLAVNGNHPTIEPVCGTVMQDVANRAQGRWFFDATQNEDPHLALVHQNWDPRIGAISIGSSVPGTGPTVLMFAPVQAGRVNLDFSQVSADGNIYCYQFTNSSTRVFLQLVSAGTLKIQMAGTGACGDPASWSFGGTAVTFSR
jgi:hypothetical protein